MTNHPEQKPNEVFVGNFPAEKGLPDYLKDLKTARLGKIAYDVEGKEIVTYMLPLFIGKDEHDRYDKIMMERIRRIRKGCA